MKLALWIAQVLLAAVFLAIHLLRPKASFAADPNFARAPPRLPGFSVRWYTSPKVVYVRSRLGWHRSTAPQRSALSAVGRDDGNEGATG